MRRRVDGGQSCDTWHSSNENRHGWPDIQLGRPGTLTDIDHLWPVRGVGHGGQLDGKRRYNSGLWCVLLGTFAHIGRKAADSWRFTFSVTGYPLRLVSGHGAGCGTRPILVGLWRAAPVGSTWPRGRGGPGWACVCFWDLQSGGKCSILESQPNKTNRADACNVNPALS